MAKLKLKDNPITAALPEDIPQIAALTMANIRDSGIPVTPCYEKIVWVINNTILNDLCFVRRNKKDPKKVDGFLLLSHRVPEYSLDSIIYGLMFYIRPEFRTFALAKSLLNSAQKYAIIVDEPLVFDLFNQVDADKKKKLLTYLGFTEVGSLYVFKP
jgi:hypothetical protein